MKIVYFAPTSSLYGDNIALLNILKELKLKGVTPIIVTTIEGLFTAKLRELGYDYITYPTDSNFWPRCNSWKDAMMFLPRLYRHNLIRKICYSKLLNELKVFKPDIIHSNNSCFGLGLIIANSLNVPHFQHVREYGRQDMGRTYFPSEKSFVRRLSTKPNDKVLCITRGIKEYFQNISDSNHWNVVYDGVIQGKPIYQESKEPFFLYVGRLFSGKNVKSLIEQFANYCKRNDNGIVLKLAGNGDDSYKNELKTLINNHNITKRVEFLGYCDDVNKLMQKALALFVPSNFEGFGFITTEAMFNGCLVVGRNTGGTKEQFDNGLELTGKEIGIRYTNDNELVKIMETIIYNGSEYYYPMISRSQQVVTNLYSIEASANQVYEMYQDILAK